MKSYAYLPGLILNGLISIVALNTRSSANKVTQRAGGLALGFGWWNLAD